MPKAMSLREQDKILENPKDPLYPSVTVMRRLHDRQLSAADLAHFLRVTRSAVSKMLNRPGGVLPHVAKIARFFDCQEADITGVKAAPKAPLPLGAPVGAAASGEPTTVLQEELGRQLDSSVIPLPPGWALVRVDVPSRGRDWYLCASVGSKPREGDDVVVTTTDGRMWFRTYHLDELDEHRVVLVAKQPSERPIVVSDAEIAEMRRVVVPLPNLR